MKHCILVKFVKEIDKDSIIKSIMSLFDNLYEVNGISNVEYISNIIDRENRYDLLIRITMEKQSLSLYDESPYHKIFKTDFKKYIDLKAIFDYE